MTADPCPFWSITKYNDLDSALWSFWVKKGAKYIYIHKADIRLLFNDGAWANVHGGFLMPVIIQR